MSRIKLKDRELPEYTRGEEIFNMVTHIVGAGLGVVALVLCIVFSCIHHNGYALFSSIIYGISIIVLYTMSAIYHGLYPTLKAKKVFQILDHCTIFVLIAGTYTPILLCAIRPVSQLWGWSLFAIVWGLSIIGIILNAIDIKSFEKLSMLLYLGLGWCIIFKINLLPLTIGWSGIYLLVLGGLCYTVGVVFYALEHKIKYMHSIWHILIILGTVCHFLCIILYVI